MSELLYIKDLTTELPDEQNLIALSFSVQKGEVLGITGLSGSGIYVLVDILCGNLNNVTGKFFWNGRQESLDELLATLKQNIYVVRGEDILIERMTVGENIEVIRSHPFRNFMVHPNITEGLTKLLYDRYQIPCKPNEKVYKLSNLDRLYLSVLKGIREHASAILLCDVCEGLTEDENVLFREFIERVCSEGRAVIIVSTDFSRVLCLTDRIMVLRNGMRCLYKETKLLELADIRTRVFPEPHEKVDFERSSVLSEQSILIRNFDVFSNNALPEFALESGNVIGFYGENVGSGEVLYHTFMGNRRTDTTILENGKCYPFDLWLKRHKGELVCLKRYFWENMIFSRLSAKENIQLRSLHRFRYRAGITHKAMQQLAFKEFCLKQGLDEQSFEIPVYRMEHSKKNRLIFYQLLYEPPRFLILDNPLYAMDEEMKRILLVTIRALVNTGTCILMCDANEQLLQVYCDKVIRV